MREKDRKLLLKGIAGELGPEEGARLDDRLRARFGDLIRLPRKGMGL